VVALGPGVVVLVRFPFSDLTSSKLRPAVVLAHAGGVDWVLCQVTSNPYGDPSAVPLAASSFGSGGLGRESFVRPRQALHSSGVDRCSQGWLADGRSASKNSRERRRGSSSGAAMTPSNKAVQELTAATKPRRLPRCSPDPKQGCSATDARMNRRYFLCGRIASASGIA
jgi:mRNA interferase MazF